MKKKILAMLLAIVMIGSCNPSLVRAAEEVGTVQQEETLLADPKASSLITGVSMTVEDTYHSATAMFSGKGTGTIELVLEKKGLFSWKYVQASIMRFDSVSSTTFHKPYIVSGGTYRMKVNIVVTVGGKEETKTYTSSIYDL